MRFIENTGTSSSEKRTARMKRVSGDKAVFMMIGYLFITLAAVFCLLPFILVISGSFSSQEAILQHGYNILPRDFSLRAYEIAFKQPWEVLRAYGVTCITTATGVTLGLFFTSMASYVLTRKDFEWRNRFAFFFYFTTLFSGGLVPWYILCVRYLKMSDSFTGLIFSYLLLNVFYILVMKSFMNNIPDAITESAKIDGANDFMIFIKLILPLSKPALATIGLFIALNFWNDWFSSYMFIQNQKLFTLQYYLYKIIMGAQALSNLSAAVPGRDIALLPSEPLKLAMTVVTTGPIVLLYPFVQKYFVSGLTIGAVKG